MEWISLSVNSSTKRSISQGQGGLFRRFVLPQILIAITAGFLGLLWAASHQKKLDEEQMTGVAEANALFLEQMRLPLTGKMAENLSIVTNTKVVFESSELTDGTSFVGMDELSGEEASAAKAAIERAPDIVTISGYTALSRDIGDDRGRMIVIKPATPWLAFSKSTLVLPLLGMTLLAVAAAFFIARSVVRPLQNLASTAFASSDEAEINMPAHLMERHDEIGILARTLAKERNALLSEQELRRNSEKMALLGQLATSLAHEIKNPAAAIIMHAKSLEQNGVEPEGRLIREDGENITSLVNQWLFVAKPNAPRKSNNDIIQILKSLKERLEPLMQYNQVSLEIVGPESIQLNCDSQRIQQAFRNLIDNAIKAMPNGGAITIEISEKEGGSIEFVIADEGVGFSDEALRNFGETFYSEREGGMGLGLALAKGVFEAHGGELSARNKQDGGACISGAIRPESS